MRSVSDWKDGLPYSNRYGDVYFSTDSGLEETRHVFLQGNRPAERLAALAAERWRRCQEFEMQVNVHHEKNTPP